MTVVRRIERAAVRSLMRMPPGWAQRIAGQPIEIDGNRLDPHLQLYLRAARLAGQDDLSTASPEASRRELEDNIARVAGPIQPLPNIEDRVADDVPVRIYRAAPLGDRSSAVVFFHGGGGVAGSIDTHDEPCRALCMRLTTTVISVEYRRAPEHVFPAADDDALRAFRWVHRHAESLGIDADRIGLAGDSFGGHLAVTVAMASANGEAPGCRAALLFYPWLDARLDSPSIATFGAGFLLTRTTMEWYRDQYMPEPAMRQDVRASPVRAPDLSGMPPTVIVTAGFDPLRDEGRAFADRLEAAGVDCDYLCADAMIHGFINFSVALPAAGEFLDRAVALFRARL